MRVKVLPMQYPVVTSWQGVANMFAVLPNFPQSIPWIMSNFIQLQLIFHASSSHVDFYRTTSMEITPWLYRQHLKRETVRMFADDPVEFFCSCIDRNNYIFVIVDQGVFLEGVGSFPHDTFIYGYDKDEALFYVADFTFKGKYSFEKVSFAQMREAYEAIAVDDERDGLLGIGGVALLSFRETRYDFNVALVRRLIEDFLACRSSLDIGMEMIHMLPPCVFGLDVYAALAEDARRAAAGKWEPDYKQFHVVYDHKKLMLKRIEYMGRHGYLDRYEELYDEYEQISHLAFLARNLVVKAKLNGRGDELIRAGKLLGEIANRERDALGEMLRRLICESETGEVRIGGVK